MTNVVRPSTPSDLLQIQLLSIGAFGVSGDSPFMEASLLHWKYWMNRSDFPEPRSYVVEVDGRVSAHVGIWPLEIEGRKGAHLIDWMAAQDSPGVGALLHRSMLDRFDFLFCIGGTEAAQKMMPVLGFQAIGSTRTWVRPLRPVRQAIRRPRKRISHVSRFLHNFFWSRSPLRTASTSWVAVPAGEYRTSERDPGFFQYLHHCPHAEVHTWTLLDGSKEEGVLNLFLVGSQARISIWLRVASVENWRCALAIGQRLALECTSACEIVFKGASEASNTAAAECGMRLAKDEQLFSLVQQAAPYVPPINYQYVDDDGAFRSSGVRPEFLS